MRWWRMAWRLRSRASTVLYLDTDGGQAIADRETYVPGRLRIQGNVQFAQQYDGPVETKGRGYTSWQSFPQKSYKLKLGVVAMDMTEVAVPPLV